MVASSSRPSKPRKSPASRAPRAARICTGDTLRVNVKISEATASGSRPRRPLHRQVRHGRERELHRAQLSFGEGVERVFPLHSPAVDSIEVRRKGGCAAPSSITSAAAPANAPASPRRPLGSADGDDEGKPQNVLRAGLFRLRFTPKTIEGLRSGFRIGQAFIPYRFRWSLPP